MNLKITVLFLLLNLSSIPAVLLAQTSTSTHVTVAPEASGEEENTFLKEFENSEKCKDVSKIDSYPDYRKLFSACGGASGVEDFVSRENGCFNCYLALAVHYSKIINYADEMRKNATMAMALRPSDVRPYELRAIADTTVEGEGLMDHLDEAMSDYLKLIELEPTVTSRKENACSAAAKFPDGFNKEIRHRLIAICSQVRDVNPTDSESYLNRGFLLLKNGKYTEALADFDVALKYDATNKKAFQGKAHIYEALKNWNKAVFYYSKYIDFGGDDYLSRGVGYLKLGLCRKAKSDFTTASMGTGYNPVIAKHYIAAYYWTCEKDLEKTLASVEKLLKMGWECEGFCYRFDLIHEFIGDLEEKQEYKALLKQYNADRSPE